MLIELMTNVLHSRSWTVTSVDFTSLQALSVIVALIRLKKEEIVTFVDAGCAGINRR